MSPSDLPSHLQLAPGNWVSLLDGLCARFPRIPRNQWLERFARGRVQALDGTPLQPQQPWRVGMEIRYFREVAQEPVIPFAAQVLYQDDELLVADKPHFLPVIPAGRYVRETLLARLLAATGNRDLVPLHRIDRGTAGLVLFSSNRRTRAAYQQLFRNGGIDKGYEALAPALPEMAFPHERFSRIERGEPFFRMVERDGPANAHSRIRVIERMGALWRYGLEPVTGRKHQLRVHMAAVGAPICGDDCYPEPRPRGSDDYSAPLQLLARRLAFIDPLDGRQHEFHSARRLAPWVES